MSIDCRSLENICHINENKLSDSAFEKGIVKQNSAIWSNLEIPNSCWLRNRCGQTV